MGFDCTLHVVDEKSLARFVDRFLGRSKAKAPFDRAYDDPVGLFDQTREALLRDEPKSAAITLGELALLWASAETPHIESRGFALSLWREDQMGAKAPTKYFESVEPLLRRIVAKYPRVRGRVPDRFDGNWCVGPFVRPARVPGLLAYVETTLDAMDPGTARHYSGLREVLRVCVARRMAYWEGTDFGVAQANEKWLATVRPKGDTKLRRARSVITDEFAHPIGRSGDRFVFARPPHDGTWVVDLSKFPPNIVAHPDVWSLSAAFAPSGDAVAVRVLRTPPRSGPRRPSTRVLDRLGGDPISVPFRPDEVRTTQGGVIVFPHDDRDATPVLLRHGRVQKLSVVGPLGRWRRDEHAVDAIPLGDGSAFVVWRRVAFRLRGRTLTRLPLPSIDAWSRHLPLGVDLGAGVIAYLANRRPVRLTMEGKREELLALDNAIGIDRGPDGALVFHEGDNPRDDVAKVLWRGGGEVTGIGRAQLGMKGSARARLVAYVAALDALVVLADKEWRALPWSKVESLPRIAAHVLSGKPDARQVVADAFSAMTKTKGAPRASWSSGQQVVWNVILARCARDMGGIESVFTDSSVDPAVLVPGLQKLGAKKVAAAWRDAVAKLERVGYLKRGKWTGADGRPHARIFDALDEAVGDEMWTLDEALALLLPSRPSRRIKR